MGTDSFPAHRRQLVGFALIGNVVPVVIALVHRFGSHPAVFLLGVTGACSVPVVVTLLPDRLGLLRRMIAFAGIFCLTLMQAGAGGVGSVNSLLLVMAMIWFGLQASPRELVAMVVVLAVCSFLPMIIVGPPDYPVSWNGAALVVVMGAVVAGATHTISEETLRLTDELRRDAEVDPLTGLLNRRGWEQAAPVAMAQARLKRSPLTLIALDLDDFKGLNDTYGHDEGDKVLGEFARCLALVLRAGDVVARLGGDEFAALLPDCTPDSGLAAVTRLREMVPTGRFAFSVGMAAWQDEESLEELLRRGDLGLYAAKSDGGSRCALAPGLEPFELSPAVA
jgi:diguanylate cyclase (GGDEF)-like protein